MTMEGVAGFIDAALGNKGSEAESKLIDVLGRFLGKDAHGWSVEKAYDVLEKTYSEQSWSVYYQIGEWIMQKAIVDMDRCTTSESLDQQLSQLSKDLIELGGKLAETACSLLDKVFESPALKNILSEWIDQKMASLPAVIDSIIESKKETLQQSIDIRKGQLDQKQKAATTRGELVSKVTDFASNTKGQKHDLQELKKMFNEFWVKLVGELDQVKTEKKQVYIELFMNTVDQKPDEVIAVDLLLGHFEVLIKQVVQRSMSLKVADNVVKHFGYQKWKLLTAIMKDLTDSSFAKCIKYIKDARAVGQEWVVDFTNRTIFLDKDESDMSKYAKLAREDVNKLVEAIIKALSATTKNIKKQKQPSMKMWVEMFSTVMRQLPIVPRDLAVVAKLKVDNYDSLEKLLYERLPDMGENILEEFKEETPETVVWEGETPSRLILEKLWGCGAQCPFCKEVCQKTEPNHVSPNDCHQCIQHRPVGVKGVNADEILKVETCNFKVQSDTKFYFADLPECKVSAACVKGEQYPYKDYKKFLPTWYIAPSPNMESSKYWLWFMAKYKEELAEHYSKNPPDIPKDWTRITKSEAVDSLRLYN